MTKRLVVLILIGVLLLVFAVGGAYLGRAYLPGTMARDQKNMEAAQQATEDADEALRAAEKAAVSARRAADSTKKTADSAAKSARDASESARDANTIVNRKPPIVVVPSK